MISSRPYLIRAIHQWIVDNGLTPHILVKADADGVQVPTKHAENGKIILNIGPQAVQDLQLDNEQVSFHARFSGTPMAVVVPTAAVLAIYARENGQGMLFNEDEDGGDAPGGGSGDKPGKPKLKIVK